MSETWELTSRLGSFALVFAAMALWEQVAEKRERRCGRPQRWTANLSISVLDALLVRLVFPLTLAGVAVFAESAGWGLLNRLEVPPALAVVLVVIVLDATVYGQHVVFHAVPALWRLHMVHHADVDFDLTTGIRFHPIEILLSMVLKMALVLLLGAPALATVIFEVLLNASSMFNHGNVSLPPRTERVVRWLLVTPDMHRVHHSVERAEANSNFGFCLSWWDRLAGTYRERPAAGDKLEIGLRHLQGEKQDLMWLLGLPFRGQTGGYPMGQRRRL